MNYPNINVEIFHNGNLISSQPWVWNEEVSDYIPSDELSYFKEGFNSEINEDTSEVWESLESFVITEIQDAILWNRKEGNASVGSMSYEAAVTFKIN